MNKIEDYFSIMIIITNNDRQFECPLSSSSATPLSATATTAAALSLDAKVLDTDEIRASLDNIASTLANSVGEYKSWLESREAEFELRYLANDFSRDIALFNRLNGVVSRVRQARKRLNGWYSHMQELLANALDQLGTYSESVAVVQSYSQPDITTVNAGIAFASPLAQAKRNVSKIRSMQKHLNTLAITESRLKTSLINLRTQMEAFSRGVIRNDGKLLDLVEVGKLVNELMGGDTPLLRVQQQLANTINLTKTNVQVSTASLNAPPVPQMTSFLENLERGNVSEANHIIERLRTMSETTLYTDNTRENIESIAKLAQTRINDQDVERRHELDILLTKIRNNTPNSVLNRYSQQARREDGVFLRVQNLNLIIANLHPLDRDLYETAFREIYRETYAEAQRSIDNQVNFNDDNSSTLMDYEDSFSRDREESEA
nr:hypothetical protein [Apis mellifera nudivirus]